MKDIKEIPHGRAHEFLDEELAESKSRWLVTQRHDSDSCSAPKSLGTDRKRHETLYRHSPVSTHRSTCSFHGIAVDCKAPGSNCAASHATVQSP